MKPFPLNFVFISLLFIFSCSEPVVPVSHEEALRLGESITQSINAGRANILNKHFDSQLFIERMRDHGSYDGLNAYAKTIREKINGKFLANEISKSMNKNGYQLLRAYEKDGQQHLVFRLLTGDGVNYHDYELVGTKDGVRIADVFIYYLGETISYSLWETGRVINEATDFLGRSRPENRELTKFKPLLQQGKYAEVKSLIENTDSAVRYSRLLQVSYITACQHLGDSIYLHALQEYQSRFPQASNAALLMIDAYAMNEQYAEGLRAIDHLDSLLGGDSYLNVSRSRFYNLLDDRQSAKQCLASALGTDPLLVPLREELISLYVEDGNFAQADSLLAIYATLPGHDTAFVTEMKDRFDF